MIRLCVCVLENHRLVVANLGVDMTSVQSPPVTTVIPFWKSFDEANPNVVLCDFGPIPTLAGYTGTDYKRG